MFGCAGRGSEAASGVFCDEMSARSRRYFWRATESPAVGSVCFCPGARLFVTAARCAAAAGVIQRRRALVIALRVPLSLVPRAAAAAGSMSASRAYLNKADLGILTAGRDGAWVLA
jgi:hypothetical protein